MIKICSRYPYSEKGRFDLDYYVNTRAPMARRLMGAALKGFEIEQGVSGREPGSNPTYVAIANLYFDTVDDFTSSYGPNAAKIQSDIPNYTDIQPVLQISEVRDTSFPVRGVAAEARLNGMCDLADPLWAVVCVVASTGNQS